MTSFLAVNADEVQARAGSFGYINQTALGKICPIKLMSDIVPWSFQAKVFSAST